MSEEPKKLFIVLTIARQVDGEYVFVKTEQAFQQAKNADALLKKLKGDYAMPDGKFKPVELTTGQGAAICQCEAGVFEVEIGD